MKATTFVERHLKRIRERLSLLEGERHVRMPLVREVAEEVLSLMAIEEDLFYPAILASSEIELRATREELSRLQVALLELIGADSDVRFDQKLVALRQRLADHAETDATLFRLAERALGDGELEALGVRMARFYRDSVGAARGAPPPRASKM